MNQTWDILQANLFYYCENLLIIYRDCIVIKNLFYAIQFHGDRDLNEIRDSYFLTLASNLIIAATKMLNYC